LQALVSLRKRFATAAWTPHARVFKLRVSGEFFKAAPNRAHRDSGDLSTAAIPPNPAAFAFVAAKSFVSARLNKVTDKRFRIPPKSFILHQKDGRFPVI
jgi:hypothetical protein